MNTFRRWAGFVWIALGLFATYRMFVQAFAEISVAHASIDTLIFWFTILPIFLPIMAGLLLFGWYAVKGEYDRTGIPD